MKLFLIKIRTNTEMLGREKIMRKTSTTKKDSFKSFKINHISHELNLTKIVSIT